MGQSNENPGLRVLLVEDHAGDRRLLEKRLARFEVKLRFAESLGEAVQATAASAPEVVLLDLGLPDSNGLETLERFRIEHGDVPVVILTGAPDEELGIAALRHGAEDFFSKDELDAVRLHRALRYACERNRLERQMLTSTWQEAGPLLIVDHQRRIVFANRRAVKLTRTSAESLAGSELSTTEPLRIVGDDGVERSFETDESPTRWQEQPASLVTLTDVTDLLRARELEARAERAEREKRFLEKEREGLRQQELQFNTILAETTDFVAAAGVGDFTIRYLNPAGRELLGFDRDEVVFGLGLLDLVAPAERMRLRENVIPAAMAEGRWTGSIELRGRDEQRIVVDAVAVLHQSADGAASFLSVIARDITERARIEERLREAQKIEAVGRLAGGIAHDFNNLLTAISSFGRFALETVGQQHEVYPDLEEILNAAEKAEGLTRQLLAFSRKQTVAPRVFPIADLVSDLERMIQRLVREDVVVETRLDPERWNVRIDPTAMEQVLINLCVNARDAMPNGGHLRIDVCNERLDAMPVVGIEPGSYVKLSVTDNGTGIEPAVLPRIFEPFYTTKEQGKGTGLGLSTCYGVVKQAGGHMDVQSELGVGSTFIVYLPRVEEAAEPRAEPRSESDSNGGTGAILVAEDNEQVRRLAARILERRGYEVEVVSNGAEALELLARSGRAFDLVLTDVIMPVMGGRELAAKLRQQKPNLTVAFMSGFADDDLAEAAEVIAGERLLAKPFTPPELLEHVRQALADARHHRRTA